MTDGTKLYDEDCNVIYKSYHDHDTTALKRFKARGIKLVFLTADEYNLGLFKRRNIPIYCAYKKEDGTRDKIELLKQIFKDFDVKPKETAYIGDDYLDIEIMKMVGTSFAPISAIPEVRQVASHIINKNGGTGVLAALYDFVFNGPF